MAENDVRAAGTPRMPDPNQLAQLSPEELAQAMEQALDEMTEDTYDPAVLDAYLDALDAQAPMPEIPDVDTSYQQFQAMVSGAVSPQEHPHTRRGGKVLRMTLRVFLAAAFLFACLVAAQAAGMNIFGPVISWTEDTFLMELPSTPPTSPTSPWYEKYLNRLSTVGLTAQDLPTWLPDGYDVSPMVQLVQGTTTGTAPFDSAFFNIEGPDGPDGARLTLDIMTHLNMDEMEYLSIDKDGTPVETYQVNDKTVYLFSNNGEAKAVCQYGDVFYFLEGDVTEDMIEPFFGSIGQASEPQ